MKEKLKKLVNQFQLSCNYGIECKIKDDIGNHGYELIFRRGIRQYRKKLESMALSILSRDDIELYIEQCFKEAVKVLGRN